MHLKSFDCLIILNDRVETLLFELLPVPAEVVFVVRVEEEKKVFNCGNDFLQFKVGLSHIQMVSLLLQLAHRVRSVMQDFCNLVMQVFNYLGLCVKFAD